MVAKGRGMWIAAEHSHEDNLQWALLRAIEWIGWPLFMSQPVVPVLLYFYDWRWILLGLFLLTLLWRVTILQWFVSVRLAGIGLLFVQLKFLTCPLMSFFIWQQGRHIIALLALLYPLVGPLVIQHLLMIIHTFLGPFIRSLSPELTMHVGPVQRRFLAALGSPTESATEILPQSETESKESPPSQSLPEWQIEELERHRRLRQRSSRSSNPQAIIWTRSSRGYAMTELENYWVDVEPMRENKFAFIFYSKVTGFRVRTGLDYESEEEAMHAVVAYMREAIDQSGNLLDLQPEDLDTHAATLMQVLDTLHPLELRQLQPDYVAYMKRLSAKTDLGFLKAKRAFLAAEGDINYKDHMTQWIRRMEAILSDQNDPQAAAKLRTTLEQEFATGVMPDWDAQQLAKLLGKK
jgi:hypothetical protein